MSDIPYIGPGGRGDMTPEGDSLAAAVEMLEDLLKQAKDGKLCAVAVASVVEKGVGTFQREFAFKGGRFNDLFVATDLLMARLRAYSVNGK